jgi:phage baseplate assembly protein W
MTYLAFPYQIDGSGRTRQAARDEGNDDYIRGLIEQLLFTAPGERVMRPDFGSGLRQLLFEGNSPELAATTQMLAQSSLQQWLGNLIVVESVEIEAVESALHVEVIYIVRRSQERQQVIFKRGTQG